MPLKLLFASIEVELTAFSAGNFPRERFNPLTFSQSRNGATLLNGQSFESKHVWTVAAVVKEPAAELLQDIYDLFQLSPGNIVLTDTIARYTEPTPRTRPLAAGTTATTVGSRVRYFAEFNAGFNSALSVTKTANAFEAEYEVSFQLIELAKRLTV